jgi:translation initiation factor 5A
MDTDGNSKDDVKIPDTDLGKEIETAFEDGKDCMVTIIAAMGESCSSGYNSETTLTTN